MFFRILLFVASLGTCDFASAQEVLRLSHQFEETDARHLLAVEVADAVAQADVELTIEIFPRRELYKPLDQFSVLSRGRLDMTVLPLGYAGEENPVYNILMMPTLVRNHDHAQRLYQSDFFAEIDVALAGDNIINLTGAYLASGLVGRTACVTSPADVLGFQARAPGISYDELLAGIGGTIRKMSSSDIYAAMAAGVLDVAATSSSSFVNYRIFEQVQCYTPPEDFVLAFMYHGLLINKDRYEALTPDQQSVLRTASLVAGERFQEAVINQDKNSIEVFRETGVEIAKLSAEEFAQWRFFAERVSFQRFLQQVPDGQRFFDLARIAE